MELLYHLVDFFSNYGYVAVFCVLIACGFGLPVPEDITLVAGGVICGLAVVERHLNPNIMVLVGLIGVLSGDGVMFFLGRTLGSKVTRLPLLKHVITPVTYAKIQDKAHKYGHKILFIARFLPGLRAPIFMTAGISHRVQFWKFILMDGAAALISVPVWVYVGYLFAHDLDKVLRWVRHSEILIGSLLGFGLLVFVIVKYVRRKK